MERGERDRARGGRPRPARHPDRGAGRGGHEQGVGRTRPWRELASRGVRPRASSCGSSRGPGEEMPIAPDTRIDRGDVLTLIGAEARGRAGGQGARVPRPPDDRHRHDLRRRRHRARRASSACSRSRSPGCRITLTASGGALIMGLVFGWLRSVRPVLRPHPRAGDLDLRHRRAAASSSAWSGSAPGPSFVTRAPEDRASAWSSWASSARCSRTRGDPVRPLRAADEPAHPAGRLRRRRDDHGRPARRPGRVAEQASRPSATPCPMPSATSC